MFDWENAIALHAMQGNRASSRGEGVSFYVKESNPSFFLMLLKIYTHISVSTLFKSSNYLKKHVYVYQKRIV